MVPGPNGRSMTKATRIRWKHPLNHDAFNVLCRSLPATTWVMQWGGSQVWKVGSKVFAIGGRAMDRPSYTFKVSALSYEILKDQPGLRPAPYLASRGLKWIQHYADPGLCDDDLAAYLTQSYQIVFSGLSKKQQRELVLSSPKP